MRALLAWLALLAFSPLGHCDPAPASDSAQILEDCAASASVRTPNNNQSLLQQCPDLERAVTELGLAEQLGPDWQRRLNRTAVAELAQQLRRYQSQPLSAAPRIDSLREVMQALQPAAVHQSRWQQFTQWLASWLRQPQQDMGWLRGLLAHLTLPPLLGRVLGYAAVAAVLALALWIVWRELKALGVLTARPARAAASAGRVIGAADAEPELPDLEALPAWQRPAALLAALVQALRRSGRLTMERALTHRELGERCAFDDAAQRTRFVGVSLLAERTLYGEEARTGSESPDPQTTQVLADGVELYRQLRA
jgi:hypothetical protein